ncbi:Fic family protein [Aromatoleum toluvorans]|uniref:Fic family protein n=1 Tax=Aromatoleum toluvorans TaxID=92002 RepID=A0ABX1PSU3_9RHOO|nr:Fic family protein [Aromatoleum toluvorans]NMG42509.1 Fic family protein [Aromatoleum toluvorans]
MSQKLQPDAILEAVKVLAAEGLQGVSSSEIHARVGGSYATVGRLLDKLVQTQALVRTGKARATRYFLPPAEVDAMETLQVTDLGTATVSPVWSDKAGSLLEVLNRPLGARTPVTYQRRFLDEYVPNESALLPLELAEVLSQEGRMQGQQPAGTYARKVLEQLLIDLSWSSSRLEGNTYSLLATEELFKSGDPPTDWEGVMLLNHKRAIEFLVDAVPTYGLSDIVIRNLHALLMQDLLADAAGLGSIRSKVVNISGTTYVPTQVPQLLEEMLSQIVGKAQLVKNPAEAAFFLWVNLAYLQPFEDGNKRTSRLAANIPLMLYNCAPLAFLDVDPHDYAKAMMGVYELLDATLAVELFAWTYRRSIRKYKVILEAMGSPDPFRVRHREHLSEAAQQLVRNGKTLEQAVAGVGLAAEDAEQFGETLRAELKMLTVHNCARYRLTIREVQAWIERGKPI